MSSSGSIFRCHRFSVAEASHFPLCNSLTCYRCYLQLQTFIMLQAHFIFAVSCLHLPMQMAEEAAWPVFCFICVSFIVAICKIWPDFFFYVCLSTITSCLVGIQKIVSSPSKMWRYSSSSCRFHLLLMSGCLSLQSHPLPPSPDVSCHSQSCSLGQSCCKSPPYCIHCLQTDLCWSWRLCSVPV